VAAGLLGALEGTEVPLVSGLVLGLAHDGTRYGVALRGGIALPLAPRPTTLHLGLPDDVDPGWEGADAGLSLLLVDVGSDGEVRLDRSVRLDGLGLAIAGPDGAPLVDTTVVVIGELGLFGQWELDLDSRVRVVGRHSASRCSRPATRATRWRPPCWRPPGVTRLRPTRRWTS
jgi:hypothetical protein